MQLTIKAPLRASGARDAAKIIEQIPAGTVTLVLDCTQSRVQGPFIKYIVNQTAKQGLDHLVLVGLDARMRDLIKVAKNPNSAYGGIDASRVELR